MIGFFGYDLAPRLERLPRRHPRDSRLPDIRMALYDTAVIVDARSGTAELWGWDLTGEGRAATEKRCRVLARIDRTGDRIAAAGTQFDPSMRSRTLTSSFNRETYLASREPGARLHCGRRRLSGQPLPAIHRHGPPGAAGPLPAAQSRKPGPVRGVPALGRPGRRLGKPGVVLPDARRPAGHAADQRDAPARHASRTRTRGSPSSCGIRPRTAPS